MSTRTATLIGKALGEDLAEYVRRHREDDRTWQWIADDLSEKTGVKYSRELLRRSFPDPQCDEQPASVAS
jgi:hypothetical protein